MTVFYILEGDLFEIYLGNKEPTGIIKIRGRLCDLLEFSLFEALSYNKGFIHDGLGKKTYYVWVLTEKFIEKNISDLMNRYHDQGLSGIVRYCSDSRLGSEPDELYVLTIDIDCRDEYIYILLEIATGLYFPSDEVCRKLFKLEDCIIDSIKIVFSREHRSVIYYAIDSNKMDYIEKLTISKMFIYPGPLQGNVNEFKEDDLRRLDLFSLKSLCKYSLIKELIEDLVDLRLQELER